MKIDQYEHMKMCFVVVITLIMTNMLLTIGGMFLTIGVLSKVLK